MFSLEVLTKPSLILPRARIDLVLRKIRKLNIKCCNFLKRYHYFSIFKTSISVVGSFVMIRSSADALGFFEFLFIFLSGRNINAQ